jgi:adenylyltransferase/sulfurtransferase
MQTRRVLLIGAGGLGCAAGLALARSGLRLALTIIDPDRVEESNLHRQVLYGARDLGAPKAERAAERLAEEAEGAIETRAIVGRFDPRSALPLAGGHELVIEGTDRHEAKFLAADACALARVPVVHAGIVRWSGWVLGVLPFESACLRCVFEDIPRDAAIPTCAGEGVIGPAVGVLGAIEAAIAVRLLEGGCQGGTIVRYDALSGVARSSRVVRRVDCALCGDAPRIRALDEERYAPACPA